MRAEVETRVSRRLGDFFVKPLQRAEQKLWVMSPWLSSFFAPLLLEAKAKGVDVRVITTDDYTPTHREALGALTESKREVTKPENRMARGIGIILIIVGLITAIFTSGAGLILTIVGIIVYIKIGREKVVIRWISKIGDDNLIVYHSDPYRPIHAKIYVADSQVALGSANLTKGGAEANLESLTWIKSPELARQMLKELDLLEKNLRLRRIPVNEVGQAIRIAKRRKRGHR